MFEYINEVSVLVSALMAVAVGSVWYSPVAFGNIWLASLGNSVGNDVLSSKEMVRAIIKGVMVQYIFFLTLAFLMYVTKETLSLGVLGGIITLCVCFSYVQAAIWESRPYTYVFVQSGYALISIYGGLSIITFWPW